MRCYYICEWWGGGVSHIFKYWRRICLMKVIWLSFALFGVQRSREGFAIFSNHQPIIYVIFSVSNVLYYAIQWHWVELPAGKINAIRMWCCTDIAIYWLYLMLMRCTERQVVRGRYVWMDLAWLTASWINTVLIWCNGHIAHSITIIKKDNAYIEHIEYASFVQVRYMRMMMQGIWGATP